MHNSTKRVLAFSVLLYFLTMPSCKTSPNYLYETKKFRSVLQPYLNQIVSEGVAGYSNAANRLEKNATISELKMLAKSEHPILRITALQILLDKPSVDNFKLVMDYLDDTAFVAFDDGEFGVNFRRVADEVIFRSVWFDSSSFNKTLDEVLTNHINLKAAYVIVDKTNPNPKYYSNIRKMAQRKTFEYGKNILDIDFYWVEYAMHALAKFKKKEDVPLLKYQLMEDNWKLSSTSFKLMKEFPDTAYLEVLEKYAKYYFYDNMCESKGSFSGEDFIETVAAYKDERSAKILASILNKNLREVCTMNSNELEHPLKMAIWQNKCKAYSKLVREVEPYIVEYHRRDTFPQLSFEVEEGHLPTPQKIYWR